MDDKKNKDFMKAFLFPAFVSGFANYTTEGDYDVQKDQEESEEEVREDASTESVVDAG